MMLHPGPTIFIEEMDWAEACTEQMVASPLLLQMQVDVLANSAVAVFPKPIYSGHKPVHLGYLGNLESHGQPGCTYLSAHISASAPMSMACTRIIIHMSLSPAPFLAMYILAHASTLLLSRRLTVQSVNYNGS